MTFQFLQRHRRFDSGSQHLFSPIGDGCFEVKHIAPSISRSLLAQFFSALRFQFPNQTQKSSQRRTTGPKYCRQPLAEGVFVIRQNQTGKYPGPNNRRHASQNKSDGHPDSAGADDRKNPTGSIARPQRQAETTWQSQPSRTSVGRRSFPNSKERRRSRPTEANPGWPPTRSAPLSTGASSVASTFSNSF